jgi:hypothetical protein
MEILANGNILIKKDFLSKEECQTITKWMNDFNYADLPKHEVTFWQKRLIRNDDTTTLPGYEKSFDDVNVILNNIKKRTLEVLKTYEENDWELKELNCIKMWNGSHPFPERENQHIEMFYHTDNQELNGYGREVFWGAVIYPNSNYLGGQIHYPKYNFKYKPEEGSVVFHRGNVRHGVLAMIEGNRYSLASTIYKKD